MQIGLQFKGSWAYLIERKPNSNRTKMSIQTKEKIVKLIEKGNLQKSVVKEIGCLQSSLYNICCKY